MKIYKILKMCVHSTIGTYFSAHLPQIGLLQVQHLSKVQFLLHQPLKHVAHLLSAGLLAWLASSGTTSLF